MVTPQAVRRWIMTGAVAGITVTGTIYGAGLKTRQEYNQEKQRMLQATPEEMITQLEVARSELTKKKNELEQKIASFSARRKAKEQGLEVPDQKRGR